MTIQRLSPAHATEYRQLRLRGLRESPAAFGSSHAEEAKFPLQTFVSRLEPSAGKRVFGAFDGERLAGVVTLVREDRRKERHKAWIFGLYVEPQARRQGLARLLIEHVLQAARQMRGLRQIRLAVVESNRPALQLYESFGFQVYGREEDALKIAGEFHSELFLVCRL